MPEVSLKRLIPLVDNLAALKLLPNVSQWVLHTVKRGYEIQFSTCPARFNRVFPTLLGPEQALVKEKEVDTLLRKEAIEVVRVLQPVIHISEEGWGMHPFLDLRQLIMIHLKDSYFHISILPQHRKFLRFAFRGEAYQYWVLLFSLDWAKHIHIAMIRCILFCCFLTVDMFVVFILLSRRNHAAHINIFMLKTQ